MHSTMSSMSLLLITIFATIAIVAEAQAKGQGKLGSSNTKPEKPTNEGIGPTVQVGENGDEKQPQQPGSNLQGLLFNAIQSNGASSGSSQNPTMHNPSHPSSAQIYNPSQWPGAPEPFQIVQPGQSSSDYKGYDALSNSPYQELLKSLASTAPMFPPEQVAHNPLFPGSGPEPGFQADPDAALDPPGPPRPPLNIDNANYLTAVASIPTRVGPVINRQPTNNNNIYPGVQVYPNQGLSSSNFQQKVPQPTVYQQPSQQSGLPPFSASYPSPIRTPSQNQNPANSNPNQYVYTYSGNHYPLTQNLAPSSGSKSSSQNYPSPRYPDQQQQLANQQALFNFNANYARQQNAQNTNSNTHRHPLNQSFGPILDSFSGQPRLNPFTVQVGDILGFPPGTPFSAVPAGLPSGSRLNKEGASFQVVSAGRDPPSTMEMNPVRRLYSELASSVVQPNSITKSTSSFEKSQEITKEIKTPFSMTSNASVVSYARSKCHECDEIDKILKLYNITVYTFELDTMEKGQEMYDLLQRQTGTKDIPQVFICGRYVGGYSKISELHKSGEMKQMLQRC